MTSQNIKFDISKYIAVYVCVSISWFLLARLKFNISWISILTCHIVIVILQHAYVDMWNVIRDGQITEYIRTTNV